MYYTGMGSIVLESTSRYHERMAFKGSKGHQRHPGCWNTSPWDHRRQAIVWRRFRSGLARTLNTLSTLTQPDQSIYPETLNLGDPVWEGAFRYCRGERSSIIKTNFSNRASFHTREFESVVLHGKFIRTSDLQLWHPWRGFGGPTPCTLADINREETNLAAPWTSLYRGTAEA